MVNGLIGTVLSELLWLCGSFKTSSLIATCATALTIPYVHHGQGLLATALDDQEQQSLISDDQQDDNSDSSVQIVPDSEQNSTEQL